MVHKMPFIQFWKKTKTYRFKRRVPGHLVGIIGKEFWIETLSRGRSVTDAKEADRLVIPLIDKTNAIIAAAEAGDYPSLADDVIEAIARDWIAGHDHDFRKFIDDESELIAAIDDRDPNPRTRGVDATFKGWIEDESALVSELTQYVQAHHPSIRIPSKSFDRIRRVALRLYRDRGLQGGEFYHEMDRRKTIETDTLKAIREGIQVVVHHPGKVASTPPGPSINLTLSALFAAYEAERNLPQRSLMDWKTAVRRFSEFMNGDPDVGTLTKANARGFKDALLKMPRTPGDGVRKLTMTRQIEATADLDVPRLSPGAANKNLMSLRTILAYAVDNDYVQVNVFGGIKALEEKAKARLPFTTDHLTTIFGSSVFTDAPKDAALRTENFWLPLIGLLTGARLEEIAQASIADVQQEAGTWFIDINTLDDKRLKGASSHRRVPIHADIIKAGFLIYVEALRKGGETRVFPAVKSAPGLPNSASWSKWFGRFKRDIGITDSRFTYHSFRHAFKDQCRSAAISTSVHDCLTGHSSGGVGATYGLGEPFAVLADAMTRIKAPIDLAHLFVVDGSV